MVRQRIAHAAGRAAREGRYREYRGTPSSTNQEPSGTRAGSRRAGGANGPVQHGSGVDLVRNLLAMPADAGGEATGLSPAVRRQRDLLQHLRQRLQQLAGTAGNNGLEPHTVVMQALGQLGGLDALVGHVNSDNRLPPGRSATKQQISQLPKCRVGEDEDLGCCCICLCEMTKGVQVRKLPCEHKFHPKCIDKWLSTNKCCPVCKQDIDA